MHLPAGWGLGLKSNSFASLRRHTMLMSDFG
jgi:hypothetical protein